MSSTSFPLNKLKNGVNAEQLIDKTYLFTQSLLSELDSPLNDTEIHGLLTAYAKLDTANGNYMLVNTILPEGYGIRSVYQAASPLAEAAEAR